MPDPKLLILASFLAIIGLLATYQVVKTVRAGQINDSDMFNSTRNEQPSLFWFGVSMQTIFAFGTWVLMALVLMYKPS